MIFDNIIQKIYKKISSGLFRFTGAIPSRVRNVLVFFCCAALIWVYFFYNGRIDDGDIEIFCSVVFVILTIFSIDRRMDLIEWNKWTYYPMVLFGIGIMVIGFIHPVGDGFIVFALDLIFIFPALYYVWINRGDFDTLYKIFSGAIVAAGIISFIYCIILSFRGELNIDGVRVTGFKDNPNYLGMMGVTTIIGGLYLLSEYSHIRRIMIPSSIGIGAGIAYMIVSVSRTSMIGSAVCILAFVIFQIKIHRISSSHKTSKASTVVNLLIIVCLVTTTMIVGANLDNINYKALENKASIMEEKKAENTTPTQGKASDRLNTEGKSADAFSSGRLTIWETYIENTTLLGKPHKDVKEKLKDAAETRAHNNIIEYYYRLGLVVGSIYFLFFIIVVILALKHLFSSKYNNRWELFVIMVVGTYSIFALLEIAFLPFMRIIPCIFFFAIAPMMKADRYNLKTIDN